MNILKKFVSAIDSCPATLWFSGNIIVLTAIIAVFLKF